MYKPILCKYPSRERHFIFSKNVRKYITTSSTDNVRFQITLDDNDPQLQSYLETINTLKKEGYDIIGFVDKSFGKISACNRDMERSGEWDILVLVSDDMIPQKQGWDEILIQEMIDNFPDSDGVLWHSDGYIGSKLNTMCILGRQYYDRFDYIYHPEYKSLWCDNTFTEVSQLLRKTIYINDCLFKHEHYSNTSNSKADKLMMTNEGFYYSDKKIYDKHKSNNFGLIKNNEGQWTTARIKNN